MITDHLTKQSPFLVIGHRGAGTGIHRAVGIENTVNAFDYALTYGAGALECDLALTRDEEVIAFHDPHIKTASGIRNIAELNLSEIHALQSHIPTLAMLLARYPNCKFIFELKSYTDWRRILNRIREVATERYWPNFEFISFNMQALMDVKRLDPLTPCDFIATCDSERMEPFVNRRHIEQCAADGIENISGHWLGFWPGKIALARKKNLAVGLGFIRYNWQIAYCRKQGATRLFTNHIREVHQALAEQK